MNKRFVFLLIFFLASFYVVYQVGIRAMQNNEKPVVVVIASYNNIKWYKKNLDALMMQDKNYSNWRAIYVDDCSTDGTGDAVERYVQQRGFGHKITVVRNERRRGALENLYRAIHTCNDNDIVCTYDGDDWFAVDNLFSVLNKLYADPQVWLTYGQYRECPSGQIGQCRPMPRSVIEQNAFRKYPWITSHLRTFYAWLFKKIRKEDLMYKGQFFSVTWDLAMMFPMLEMAGKRTKFNQIVVYEYNMDNPINDWKKDLSLMLRMDRFIRLKPRYRRLHDRNGRVELY